MVAHIICATSLTYHKAILPLAQIFSPVVQSYQSFLRQFQREGVMLAKRSKEGLTSKSNKQFYFERVLETLVTQFKR